MDARHVVHVGRGLGQQRLEDRSEEQHADHDEAVVEKLPNRRVLGRG